MKKALKKTLIILITICSLLVNSQTIKAEHFEGYTIDLDTLNSDVRNYVSSFTIDKETKEVTLNNASIGYVTSDPKTLSKSYSNYTIYATISLSNNTVDFDVRVATTVIYQNAFVFMLEDEQKQACYFYPKYGQSSSNERRTAELSGGYYDFGTFYSNLDGTSVSFSVRVNDSTGTVYINGSNAGNISKSNVTQMVYLEDWVDAHVLALNYLDVLPRKNWATASRNSAVYSATEVDNAVIGEKITYKNNKTGLTSEGALRRTIGIWHRVDDGSGEGDGTYSDYGRNLQVVCEWPEGQTSSSSYTADCSSISSQPRYWAVYKAEATPTYYVDTPAQKVAQEYTGTLYQNAVWNSSGWVESSSWPTAAAINSLGVIQYSSRTRDWNPWTNYIYSSCTESDTRKCASKNMYRQAYRSWQTWSGWGENNTCGTFDGSTCEEESRIRYDTKYATYGDWSSWTAWDTAFFGCSSTTLKECESKEWYRYRTRTHTPESYGSWSGWSAYEYALFGCSESDTKECRTTTARAYRKIGDWSGWSDYSTTDCSPTYSGANNTAVTGCMHRTEYRYRTRSNQYKSCADSACGVSGYSYSSYKYTYGSKPSPAYDCSSSTVTHSSCGTKTQYAASCSCLSPKTNKKTCTGAYSDSKTPCTISGCSNRKCSYTSKTVNKSCTRYYCATSRTAKYNSCRTSGCGEESWGSWSGWSTTSCSDTTLKDCDTRQTHAKRTRSWGSYGNYTLDTTYLNNSLYDYKTQTWYSSRTRTYTPASTGSWSSWTGYIYTSCSETSASDGTLTKDCDGHTEYRSREREYVWHDYTGNYTLTSCSTLDTSSTIPIRYCKSQNQYRNRHLGAYGGWTDYLFDITSSEWLSCSTSNLCKQEYKTLYAQRTANPWGNWGGWYTTSSSKSDSDTMQYKYRYNINYTLSWSPSQGSGSKGTTNSNAPYYTGNTKTGTYNEEIDTKVVRRGSVVPYSNVLSQTESQVKAYQSQYANESANISLINSLNASKSPVTYTDYTSAKGTSTYSNYVNSARNNIEGQTIYVPNIYITSHWRAINKEMPVSGYNNTSKSTSTTITKTTDHNNNGVVLIEITAPQERESKVFYIDPNDPMRNQDEIPDIDGLDELIDAIKASTKSNEKITITITKDDMVAMKSWLESNNYNRTSDCEFLKEFAYMFDDITQASINSQACRIEGD